MNVGILFTDYICDLPNHASSVFSEKLLIRESLNQNIVRWDNAVVDLEICKGPRTHESSTLQAITNVFTGALIDFWLTLRSVANIQPELIVVIIKESQRLSIKSRFQMHPANCDVLR